MAITFINADLKITADEPLNVIRDAFASLGQHFYHLYCEEINNSGVFLATFETYPECELPAEISDDDGASAQDENTSFCAIGRDFSAQEKIALFCNAIEGFDGAAKALWLRARKRVMDLGYDTDDYCAPFRDTLDLATLQRLAALNIELAITIYPVNISVDGSRRRKVRLRHAYCICQSKSRSFAQSLTAGPSVTLLKAPDALALRNPALLPYRRRRHAIAALEVRVEVAVSGKADQGGNLVDGVIAAFQQRAPTFQALPDQILVQ